MDHPAISPIPTGMHTITPHIVVRDAASAAAWYARALDADERHRLSLPNGKIMSLELWFGTRRSCSPMQLPRGGHPVASSHWWHGRRPAPLHGGCRHPLAARR